MWALLPSKEFQRGTGEGNRRALRKMVRGGATPGLLAYHDGEPIAWCALGPRDRYVRLDNSRTWQRVDDQPVWSVVCFFVKRGYRGKGVASALLRAAIEYAKHHGGKVLESYPVEPRKDRMPDVFAFTGVVAVFRNAGFAEILRRSETRPIMRFYLGEEAADARQPVPEGELRNDSRGH